MRTILTTLRPQQWVKNFVLFAGLIFSQNLGRLDLILETLAGFALFCLLSSSAYIFNDILDVESDRKHPLKSARPIAKGEFKISTAIFLFIILALISLGLSVSLSPLFALTALIYFILNLLYSLYLKHVVIIDVMCIALGFVIRAVAGAVLIGVEISAWLVVCTTLLALFLGFGKRRHELLLLETQASDHRKILSEYSPYFLDQMISVVTASTVVAYAFYTLSPEVETKLGTGHMELTIPFVLYGVFRYLYLIHQREGGGSPTRMLLNDKPILVNVLLWLLAVILIVYVF
ncbi:MAG: phosphoribose diphosphate--decaprenyl-phosphate phosphoribosyltransferase [candidate division Zixibacteria bacterium SM23_73_3]|nr:MAG: phosphoribose diphosphate--decaprenyl-phosphate phosphoribosyltransferase [candidate division Zixibacteria bacterium SM23_73_3]